MCGVDEDPSGLPTRMSRSGVGTFADPFHNEYLATMPLWWKGVRCVVGLTIFPVRVAVLLALVPITSACLVPFWPCLDCVLAIRGDVAEDRPHGRLRRAAVYPLRAVSRLLLWCFGIWYVRVERRPGCARTARDRPVVVSNHVALLDAFLMAWMFAPMPVAKADVATIPIAGGVARALQTIFVDRLDAGSKHRTLDAIERRTRDARFPSLLIFPEGASLPPIPLSRGAARPAGTCTNGKVLVQFKKGPFAAKKPVQPVVLRYNSPYVGVAATGDNEGRTVAAFLAMMLQPYFSGVF